MKRSKYVALLTFFILTLSAAAAVACSCTPAAGKVFVADSVPSDFTGVALILTGSVAEDAGTTAVELQRQEGGAWVTVATTTQSGLLQPSTPWSEGERYRTISVGTPEWAHDVVGADREFEIGPPLGTLSADLTISTEVSPNNEICGDSCLPGGTVFSEGVDVSFQLPVALEPYAELVQIEQFVDDQPYRIGYLCEFDGPFTGLHRPRVAVPCEVNTGPVALSLRYDAVIAGAPDVTIESASTTVTLDCPACSGSNSVPANTPDGGQAELDMGGSMGSDDQVGCSSTGGSSPAGVVVMLAFLFIGRGRRSHSLCQSAH